MRQAPRSPSKQTALWIQGAVLVLLCCLGLAGCNPGSYTSEESDQNIQTGKYQRRSGFYEEAEQAFHRALQNNPKSATAHFELGLLYYENMTNYASALYHFERFHSLRPKPPNEDVLKLMIVECKRELAKDVPLGSIGVQQQQEIKRLKDTNAVLLLQVEQLRLQLAQRPIPNPPGQTAATNPPPTANPDTPAQRSPQSGNPRQVSTSPTTTESPRTNAPPAATTPRTHTVKAGETMAAIARKYKLELPALLAANPAIDPRRLQPGQTVRIPSP